RHHARSRLELQMQGSLRAAGFGDKAIAEEVAGDAGDNFTNCFDLVAGTEIDFPKPVRDIPRLGKGTRRRSCTTSSGQTRSCRRTTPSRLSDNPIHRRQSQFHTPISVSVKWSYFRSTRFD